MLDKNDEKTIEKIVVKSVMVAMDQLITPQLDDIYSKLEEHDKRFEKIDNKLIEHDDKFEELQMTVDRLEMKLDAEVRRDDLQDDKIAELDKKVLKLAKSKA